MSDNDAEPPDDLSIDGRTKVLRRLVPGRYKRAAGEPEDNTFRPDGDGSGASVTLWISDDDLDIVTSPFPDFGVVSIYVDELRAQGLRIAYVDEPGNPNHCEIFGNMPGKVRRALSGNARWVKYCADYPDEFKKPLWKITDA